jgi:NAD-dependent dihydropyrimidine dehydrogenase PreA subunit
MYPVVDRESCDGCENCVEVCPSEVYLVEDGKSNPVYAEECIECGACVDQCPTKSIELQDD